jgi:hypothetical protein
VVIGVLIIGGLGFIAGCIILAVMFSPDEEIEPCRNAKGQPLVLEAKPCPNPVHGQPPQPRPQVVSHVGVWDEVDQAWGDAQWMMAVGSGRR